jgi:FtsP/CotA-like multicopper oxidase with cupredoxin domain
MVVASLGWVDVLRTDPAVSVSAAELDPDLNYKGDVTEAEKEAAAERFKSAWAVGMASALFGPAEVTHVVGPDGELVPHYFGPYPNYGLSPLPTVETDPVSGAVTSVTGGIRKFVDSLAGLGAAGENNLGQYLPVAVADTVTFPGSDYYEIALVEYEEQMHTDMPPTRLRGYVQLSTSVVPGLAVPLFNIDGSPILKGNGTQAYGVDIPHYLGPVIVAQKDWPVRIKFYNLLPIGQGGDLFIPTDTTVMGSGMGPVMDMITGDPIYYTENRATLHLHGGRTPWISDGTPHQWITPAGEDTPYPEGVSVYDVPDMFFDADGNPVPAGTPGATTDPGDGSMTFYYTNQQSARFMFYHDHAFGITRLNVYVGEAAGYLITDEVEQELIAAGVIPAEQIPLVIQDKTFVADNTTPFTNIFGTFASQMGFYDPTWNTAKYGGLGSLWYPHVYMPVQNPYDMSGVNPFGRWHYGPWFWPPTLNIDYPPVINPYYDPVNAPWEPPYIPGTPSLSMGMESFFDTPVVNGTVYPYLELEPKTYRFRILNAANDRFFNLQLYVADPNVITFDGRANTEVKMVPAAPGTGLPENWPVDGREGGVPDPASAGPAFIQIGTEGGFLPQPVVLEQTPITWNLDPTTFNVGNVSGGTLILGSAERADVIVDFSQYAGQTLILYNDAPAPFPALAPQYDYYTGAPDMTDTGSSPGTQPGWGPNTRTIMQIRVAGSNQPQTRLEVVAPNVVNPGDIVTVQASVIQLPGAVKTMTAGLPIQFDYVMFNLQTGTQQTGSVSVNTDASGNASLILPAPMETSVILVDAVFLDFGGLLASSSMRIISVQPVIAAKLTATPTGNSVIFQLADQFGNPMAGQLLTFLTTGGTLSTVSGVTSASGIVSVTLSGAPSAVVSGSFGGYIDPQGWAYQPTMARITLNTTPSASLQTRLELDAVNVVSPGGALSATASVIQLPAGTKVLAAGIPVQFNYVIFQLQSSTQQTGTVTVNTDAAGNATLVLGAPMETSVILVDAVFYDWGGLLASSNMRISSVLPIIAAEVTGIGGGFHLADQFGNAMAGQLLTFLTTSGTLSVPAGVTGAGGDVAVGVSGTPSAVVSGSFGGYISPQGWAYQPTMARITIAGATALAAPFDLAALNEAFVPANGSPGVFVRGQDPIIVGQTAYNAVYNTTFPSAWPYWGVSGIQDNSISFQTVNGQAVDNFYMQPKAIQDEMGEAFDTEYGRMSGFLGLQTPFSQAGMANFVLYPFTAPPVEIITPSILGTPIGTAEDGTQIWKITHNGVDTHPIHFHLYEVQLLNRVGWDGAIRLPDPNELGWKDVIRVSPLEDTIVALRPVVPVLPFEVPNSIRLLDPTQPENAVLWLAEEIFDPSGAPFLHPDLIFDPVTGLPVAIINHYVNFGWEYVWHCHILSHEEMDMMHIQVVAVKPSAPLELTAIAGPPGVNLAWTDDSLNETQWTILRATSATGPWTTIATIPSTTGELKGGTVGYADAGVAPGTYYYQVIASNVVGDTTAYTGDPEVVGFPNLTQDSIPVAAGPVVVP